MKKRLLVSFSAVVLVIAMTLAFCSCEINNNDYTQKYTYSSCDINEAVSDEYATLQETVEFVYSDCTLKFFDDGTWVIDTPILFVYNLNIDEGTYTVDELTGIYNMEGFEYGTKTHGLETANEFVIYFTVPDGIGYATIFTLHFAK